MVGKQKNSRPNLNGANGLIGVAPRFHVVEVVSRLFFKGVCGKWQPLSRDGTKARLPKYPSAVARRELPFANALVTMAGVFHEGQNAIGLERSSQCPEGHDGIVEVSESEADGDYIELSRGEAFQIFIIR